MKVKKLIKELLDYNMEAEVKVVANHKKYDYSIDFGGKEGVEKHNTKEVSFYVDEACKKENEEKDLKKGLLINLTDVIAVLSKEFNLSDMYAQEIRNALQMEETQKLLKNIKIR